MNVNDKRKKTLERQREYQRGYYKRNAERIKEKYNQEQEQIRERKKCNSLLEMFQEWNLRLQERLEQDDLDNWLQWALKLTRDNNNRQIEQINGRTREGDFTEED